MSHVNMQDIRSVGTTKYEGAAYYHPFSVVKLIDKNGFEVNLFVTDEQAEAIAAVFAPKVNSAGVPVFEGGQE